MKLSETYLAKTDPLLRDALQNADRNEILGCLMLLGPKEGEAKVIEQELEPSQFPSRLAYRKALIAQRQEFLKEQIGDTLKALQALSLKPRGGEISMTVVVEGTARQLWAALALPTVRHATLDRVIRLSKPRLGPVM
ncbi:MAG: hypothetical protein ACPGWR_06325 [Ardenticatenaceae bacterium]